MRILQRINTFLIGGQFRNVETAISVFPQFHMCQLLIFDFGWRQHIHCQGCRPETSWTQQNTEEIRKYCKCLGRAVRRHAHTKQMQMLHSQELRGKTGRARRGQEKNVVKRLWGQITPLVAIIIIIIYAALPNQLYELEWPSHPIFSTFCLYRLTPKSLFCVTSMIRLLI